MTHSTRTGLRRLVLATLAAFLAVPAAAAPTVTSICGSSPTPTYAELAGMVAPVLWFSPDEPLLGTDRRLSTSPLPHPLPDARPAAGGSRHDVSPPVVYFRVAKVRTNRAFNSRGAKDALKSTRGLGDHVVPLTRLSAVKFLFYVYFRADVGFGDHTHDLEVVEITLNVASAGEGDRRCHVISLDRIVGAAHGSDWYANTLAFDGEDTDDMVMPPHVLVEEGKHALAPDRNADGWFSPGYDVTRDPKDAWGIRDALRNKRQGGRGFSTEHTKDRTVRRIKALPPDYRCPAVSADCDGASVDRVAYSLEEAGVGPTAGLCDATAVRREVAEGARLAAYLDKWKFCEGTKADGPRGFTSRLGRSVFAGPAGPGDATRRDRWTVAYVTQSRLGARRLNGITSTFGFGIRMPLVEGWLVPRGTLLASESRRVGRLSTDLLYTPSGSRPLDWYLVGGWQYDRDAEVSRHSFVQEFGVKWRFPWEKVSRVNSMVGGRLGYRGQLLRGLQEGRLVIEVGLGAW